MPSYQRTPITQDVLESRLENGLSLKGMVIGDADFSDRGFDRELNFYGAICQGKINFKGVRFSGVAAVNFRSAIFSDQGGADFSKSEFSDEAKVDFSKSQLSDEAKIDFSKSQFSGEAQADFSGAQFSDVAQANFFGAQFSGKAHADFSSAQFSGKAHADFTEAHFSDDTQADFSSAKISGETQADFSSAKFLGKAHADFTEAHFSDETKVNFSWTKFSDETLASFSVTKFSGKAQADFCGAEFLGEARADFFWTKFLGEAQGDFSFTNFKDTSECLWVDTELSGEGSFKFTHMKCAKTANIRFESVNLSGASFYLTDIEDFTFKNITWGTVREGFMTRFVLKDEKTLKTDIKKRKTKKLEQEINSFRQVEILYRQLKRNYEEKRDYHGAGDFHFGELEMRRNQKTWWGQWTSLTLPYRILSGYGEKWGRALVSFFIAVFLFAGLNLIWMQPKDNPATAWEQSGPMGRYVESSLFTFKLMTLQRDLKYEAVDTPVWLGWVGKFALILEFLSGPTLIALMLLAIRRQFRR